jgi:hypothetical protein
VPTILNLFFFIIMVKLYASLLALALATGLALALSDDYYHRRSEPDGQEIIFAREEYPYRRELLEKRQPNFFLHVAKNGLKKLSHHGAHNAIGNNNNNNNNNRRELDAEEFFGREYDFEAREPVGFSSAVHLVQAGHKAAHRHHAVRRVGQVADVTDSVQNAFQNRAFENDEDLFGRDLDAEELFGRRYGRGARKALARPPPHYSHVSSYSYSRVSYPRVSYPPPRRMASGPGKGMGALQNIQMDPILDHLDKAAAIASDTAAIRDAFQSRGFEDDEEPFRRDLDAESLRGREYYDLLDERDFDDDLD